MLQVQLLCSCGLLITCGKDSVLIDAPNSAHRTFQVMDEQLQKRFAEGEEPFHQLRGLAFTHTHPDHCDLNAVHRYLRLHPACSGFIPSYDEPDQGRLEWGNIRIEFCYLPHMRVPEGMKKHYALLVEVEGKTLYLTGNAVPEPQLHASFLAGRHIDMAFWNPYHIVVPEMRHWMRTADVQRHCVYHIPVDERDETGIRRKLYACVSRDRDELGAFQLLTSYPAEISIT